MSRKKLTHVSENRDEADRVKFQCNSPVDPDRPGICGAPVECFVSIHEKTLKYGECLPQFGHSPIGVPCVRRGPAPSSQPSYNVIIAVDVRVGVVAYLIYRGTLDRDTFYCWVALQLIPALEGTGPRIVLADNHSSHHTAQMQALLNANGHKLINGSIHSPDMAPAEWGFAHSIKFSQTHESWLRQHPSEYAQVFAAGLRSITPEYMQTYFADAHFLVPGLEYKPYRGD